MADIRVGDTVRVTREFVVSDVSSYAVRSDDVLDRGYNFRSHDVEVVAKRPSQVGDVIASREDLANLPENSVVTNRLGRPIIVRSYGTVNRHGEVDGFTAVRGTPPYKVVSLGE